MVVVWLSGGMYACVCGPGGKGLVAAATFSKHGGRIMLLWNARSTVFPPRWHGIRAARHNNRTSEVGSNWTSSHSTIDGSDGQKFHPRSDS